MDKAFLGSFFLCEHLEARDVPHLSTQLGPDFPGAWVSGEAQTLRGLSQAAGWVEVLQRCVEA